MTAGLGRRCKFCNWIITGSRAYSGYIWSVCEDGRRKYNMNRLQQQALLLSQDGLCRHCDRSIVLHDKTVPMYMRAVVDHVHVADQKEEKYKVGVRSKRYVKGILCAPCNVFLAAHEEDKGMSLPDDYPARVRDYCNEPALVYTKEGMKDEYNKRTA